MSLAWWDRDPGQVQQQVQALHHATAKHGDAATWKRPSFKATEQGGTRPSPLPWWQSRGGTRCPHLLTQYVSSSPWKFRGKVMA